MLLNNYWATQHRISIFIQPSKVLFDEGKPSVDNSDRKIAHLKPTNFHFYLFLRAKKNRILRVQVFENFEFINFSPKEKGTKRQLNQGIFG